MSKHQTPGPLDGTSVSGALESLRIKQLEEQSAALRNSVICAFNQLLDLKDLNTGVHSTRLAEWGMRVGQELGLEESELQNLEVAALLHDIGKVGIPDAILRKPGRLDPDEYTLMKKHSEYGWAVLRMLPGFERAALDILHHHESFDGKGYPAGLKNTEIPVVSRIVCVIDAFDAMVSSRPYRKGLPYEEAVRRLNESSGTQFDPAVVRTFLSFAQAEMSTVFAAAGTSVFSAL
ncbi:MAG TPA: HD-GYP domain-containing protein [Candidatus Sulfotelmatobacter sp.]|jgi:HD-GYP domain-containing protein (c-di-GMP phosphodiesterase class II)|nr:HD-GYP domain-containing protein [Candidatus Sulfotelmatobacter sp.]